MKSKPSLLNARNKKQNILLDNLQNVPVYVHLCVLLHCQSLSCHDLVDEFKSCTAKEKIKLQFEKTPSKSTSICSPLKCLIPLPISFLCCDDLVDEVKTCITQEKTKTTFCKEFTYKMYQYMFTFISCSAVILFDVTSAS